MQHHSSKEKDHQKKFNLNLKRKLRLKLVHKTLLVAVLGCFLLWVGYLGFQENGMGQAGRIHAADSAFLPKQARETQPTLDQASGDAQTQPLLAPGKGLKVVQTHCTPCHSAKLIVQNRATREGWRSMIRWMQETQNLWELGENEELILDYLSTHYSPEEKGRRENLQKIEWYILEDNPGP